MRRKLPALALAVALATLGGVAAARGDGGSYDYQLGVAGPTSVGAGEPFLLDVTVGLDADTLTTTPTTALSLTWDVDIPAGVKVIAGAWHGHPLATACVSACPFDMPQGTISQPYDYQVVATTPGTYTFSAELATTSTADADPSNNRSTTSIDVVPLKLHLASVTAARPRAGKRFTWTIATSSAISGLDVRAARATCSGRLGTKKRLAGKPTIMFGRLVCAWVLPGHASGSRFTATAQAGLAAASASLTRTFAVRR